ncbi:hypothetical protein [Pedobacter borealis]|uniref:hypothetical protein n=1 Tax=Pedobacter borealis TaxID=475254 RepID=UPI0012F7FB40|nr:hypothetical protein [Pedobacter borealis]
MAISRNLFPALLICAIFACNSNTQKTTFDSKKWSKRDSMGYVFRDTMLKDLVGQRKIKGLTRDELIALLGKPENYNGRDKQLFYPIIQHYTPPVRAKWFIVQLDVDNKVDEFQIVDSNNIKDR